MSCLLLRPRKMVMVSLLCASALAIAAVPAAASWDDWNCNLRCYWGAIGGSPSDTGCYFGVRPGATDGYDPILPEPCKPVPQGEYVFAWFDRSGWGTCPRAEDYRAPIPEGTSKVWGPGLTETWNVKTTLGAAWSGIYDQCTGELQYPVAASVYITWVFGMGDVAPYPVPPDDYTFTMQYKGGINPKPAGTKLADALVPAMNQTWDMEATPHIAIALWPDYFQPYTPDCASFAAFDVAKFKFIVNNPDTVPYCDIDADPPTPQPAPATYTFTATACCDPIVAYAWDFGDGGTATGNPVTHTYAYAGIYAVTCTVTDADGDAATCTWQIPLVDCPPPVCCFTYTPEAPRAYADTVEFTDCSTPGAPECSIDSWEWDFGDGGTSDERDPSYVYLAQGTYTVCLLVMSGPSPALCCQDITIHPPPEPPLCEVLADPPNPNVGEAVTFTMGGLCCPAPGLTYDWDFDCDGTVDATTFEVNTASHVYAAAGNYTACAKVSNGGGLLCEAFVDVVVTAAPLPPVCCFSGPGAVTVGQEACWDDCSFDVDGVIVSGEWTLDGSPVGSDPQLCYTFAGGEVGAHTLTLCVVDDDGLTACCSLEVNVGCPPSDCGELAADPAYPDVGETVTFTQWTPPCGAPFTYDWDFECDGVVDATTVDVNTATHIYTSPGDYVACVKVTNSLSQWCEAFVDVHVKAPPVCAFTRQPTAAYVCDLFEFEGGGSDPDGIIVSWDWDFGDGAVGSGQTSSHRYSAPGVYTVTLTLTDDDGNTAQCSDSVVVWAGSDFDWNCNLRCYWGALDGSPRDTECFFGVKPGATDGYDLIDSLKPPEPMGDYVYAWFYRPAWGAPSTNVKADWRSPIPEGTSKVWGPGISDTWNVKTNRDSGLSGYFDPACDPLHELRYPVAASIYINWEFGVSETPPGPVPPADYFFTMQYKGGINAKPPGTKLGDATVPAVNQTWDMETTPQIVIPLWDDAFQPFTAECGMAAADTAKFKFIVTNPQTMPPLTCWITVGGTRECGAPLTFDAHAVALYGVASVVWDFGDGSTAVGDPVTHAYAAPGGYLVTCTVTDECGLTLACDYGLVIAPTTVSFFLAGPAWHMISLPCDIIDPDPGEVFDELRPPNQPLDLLSGSLHRYDPVIMGYRTWFQTMPGGFGGPLRLGEGYWLYVHDDVTITYQACCPPGERAIHFPVPGWYIFGNPCPHPVDMRTDQVQADCGAGRVQYSSAVPNCFGDPLVGYDPEAAAYSYVTIGTLYPGHELLPFRGYWIDVKTAPSTLYIMCSEAPP